MIIKLILAAVILYVLWGGIGHFKRQPQANKKKLALKYLLVALIGIVVFGVASGRMPPVAALVAALIPLFRFGSVAAFKLLPLWINRGGSIPIKTPYIDGKIELKTRQVTGTILQGALKGQELSALGKQELMDFAEELREKDKKAHFLVRQMLLQDEPGKQHQPPDFGEQDYQEALATLGLEASPSREQIVAAHRRLINKLHPDRGGSDFLAARVNQARDILLKQHS